MLPLLPRCAITASQVCILNGGASTLRMQGLLSTAGPATMENMRRSSGRSNASASAVAAVAAAAASVSVPKPRMEVLRMDDAPAIYGGSYYDDI